MKTLSVQQPWATFIAQGWKTIEVRTWKTDYRGALLIAASKGSNLPANVTHIEEEGQQIALPRGVALCVVDLLDCRRQHGAGRPARRRLGMAAGQPARRGAKTNQGQAQPLHHI